jgi:glutathione peroxidase-family protein
MTDPRGPAFVPGAGLVLVSSTLPLASTWIVGTDSVCSRRPPGTPTRPSTTRCSRRCTPMARIRRRPRLDVEIPDALYLADPMRRMDGTEYDFAKTKGKVVWVLNVASLDVAAEAKFAMLVDIYSRYRQAGLEIIAFPSNWYGQKEPGSDEEVAERINALGVKFVVMSKHANFDIELNPVFELGIKRFPGEILWNFHGSFLFDRNGIPSARFDLLSTAEYIENKLGDLI